ncbi:CRISPR-associated protein Cas4 [Fontivita pretiosa]|uniref:CRISPR-associated protein Cas4 n=1 Tax=Fontivita pretiosa TaxID=2989684 RepID=UPI003D166505
MFCDDELLPISALQHLLYCPRQCALIHVERLWAENRQTVEGRHLHHRADSAKAQSCGALRIARSVPLRSLRLGLWGKADVVEFHPSACGAVTAFPVEYKRGRPKPHHADQVQLCAQALCLEEMLGTSVHAGALFYARIRRRLQVPFDDPLRRLTEQTVQLLHDLLRSGHTPPAVYQRRKCDRCSLLRICLPTCAVGASRLSGSAYLDRSINRVLTEPPPQEDQPP